jgi:hypothetical protein
VRGNIITVEAALVIPYNVPLLVIHIRRIIHEERDFVTLSAFREMMLQVFVALIVIIAIGSSTIHQFYHLNCVQLPEFLLVHAHNSYWNSVLAALRKNRTALPQVIVYNHVRLGPLNAPKKIE